MKMSGKTVTHHKALLRHGALIHALGGFHYRIQRRGGLWSWYLAHQDVACWNALAVEGCVGVGSLEKSSALQGHTGVEPPGFGVGEAPEQGTSSDDKTSVTVVGLTRNTAHGAGRKRAESMPPPVPMGPTEAWRFPPSVKLPALANVFTASSVLRTTTEESVR